MSLLVSNQQRSQRIPVGVALKNGPDGEAGYSTRGYRVGEMEITHGVERHEFFIELKLLNGLPDRINQPVFPNAVGRVVLELNSTVPFSSAL